MNNTITQLVMEILQAKLNSTDNDVMEKFMYPIEGMHI